MKEFWLNNWKVLLGSGGLVGLVTLFVTIYNAFRNKPTPAPSPIPPREDNPIDRKLTYEYFRGLKAGKNGDSEEALEHFLNLIEACAGEEKTRYSYDHALACSCAGAVCDNLTRHEDAHKYYDDALTILEMGREKKWERDILLLQHSKAITYLKEEKPGKALSAYTSVYKNMKRVFGEEYPNEVAAIYNGIGAALEGTKAKDTIIVSNYLKAFLTEAHAAKNPNTMRYLNDLKRAYEKAGKKEFETWLSDKEAAWASIHAPKKAPEKVLKKRHHK